MKNSFLKFALIFIALVVMNTLLSRYASIDTPFVTGITEIYFAVAFMIVFALWFGMWGVIAAYLGCFIGSGVMMGLSPGFNLYWSLADAWQVLIPLIAFKTFVKADIGLKKGMDFAVYIVFGILLNNVVGAAWGTTAYLIEGTITRAQQPEMFLVWATGNIIVTLVITTLLLRFVTPYLEKSGLLVKGYWA